MSYYCAKHDTCYAYHEQGCPKCVGITPNEKAIKNVNIENFVSNSNTVIGRAIWNAAIEAASNKAMDDSLIFEAIRRFKK